MKLIDVKLGDKVFGVVHKYNYRFMKGIEIVEAEVTKINKKTVGLSYDSDTRECPQLFIKDKEYNVLNIDKSALISTYLNLLESSNFPEYLKQRIREYCKRK